MDNFSGDFQSFGLFDRPKGFDFIISFKSYILTLRDTIPCKIINHLCQSAMKISRSFSFMNVICISLLVEEVASMVRKMKTSDQFTKQMQTKAVAHSH